MRRYVIIPTRYSKEECGDRTTEVGALNQYFQDAGWEVHFLRDAPSMLEAYESGIEECELSSEDYVIFCHDDIEILLRHDIFNEMLEKELSTADIGFVGVAGSTSLGQNSDTANWCANGNMGDGSPLYYNSGGVVFHGKSSKEMSPVWYGIRESAVLMDGVFLATTGKVANSISFKKPSVIKSNWHMYDAFMTFQTYRKKLRNVIAPIILRHASGGDYASEHYDHDSKMFMALFERELPTEIPLPELLDAAKRKRLLSRK
jgi:hypothetical protein